MDNYTTSHTMPGFSATLKILVSHRYVDFLDGKGRWGMLRRVYAAINGVPQSEMKDFFEAKGWPADED